MTNIVPVSSLKTPVQVESAFEIKISIQPEVYKKIMYWVNKCDFEISGLGKVVYNKTTGEAEVVDACLLEQVGSHSETELSAEAISKAMYTTRESPGTLSYWWHSHVNMSVFWSGTDMTTIKQLGGINEDIHKHFFMTVFNKKREMKSAYVQNYPANLILPDIPTIVKQANEPVNQEWEKEYQAKVKQKTYASSNLELYRSQGILPHRFPIVWSDHSMYNNDFEEGLFPSSPTQQHIMDLVPPIELSLSNKQIENSDNPYLDELIDIISRHQMEEIGTKELYAQLFTLFEEIEFLDLSEEKEEELEEQEEISAKQKKNQPPQKKKGR